MPSLHWEPLIFGLVWAALALFAGFSSGWLAGILLSVGLMILIMPVSNSILVRTDNMEAERGVRWGILAMAALLYGLLRS